MKGLEKLTCIRLAEVLTQKGVVETDAITDALYVQDRHGESFVNVLVDGGHITEWDLAKIVVENFQIPFIMASNHEVTEEAKASLPKDVLFQSLLIPIDKFDDIITVVMPILTPFEVLAKVRKTHGVRVFPYVGLISENKKVMAELFADFNDWAKKDAAERERRMTQNAGSDSGAKSEGDWMNIFDSGDEQVRNSLGNKG